MEILAPLSALPAPERVIRDYAAHVTADPADRAGSFRGFVAASDYAKRHPATPSLVIETHQRALATIGEEVLRRHGAAAHPPRRPAA